MPGLEPEIRMKLASATLFAARDPGAFADHDYLMLQTLASLVNALDLICPLDRQQYPACCARSNDGFTAILFTDAMFPASYPRLMWI